MKKIVLFFTVFCLFGFAYVSKPTGKASEIFNLINEARANPKAFLVKYKSKIQKLEPKFVSILEKSLPIEKIIWDEKLTENCKERVYGNLNPEYTGVNKMCGRSYSSGDDFFSDEEALYFLCSSYIHVMNEDAKYFGFYIDPKGFADLWGKSCESKRKYTFTFKQNVDSSKVDFNKINTAKNEKVLNNMDKDMIKEINFVRQYPKVYASIISEDLAEESKNRDGLTKEKYDAGVELIEELKVMKPAQILYPKECLYKAIQKHGKDCQKRGFTNHTGSDGSSPFSRVAKYCPDLKVSENIVGGSKDVRSLVIQLLIDEGISSRGHRYNILDPSRKYISCYGYQGKDMYNYIQNFAKD